MKTMTKVRGIVLCGLFAAIIAILTLITIPLPGGVPVTMQTFAVALTGYVLGWRRGTMTLAAYLAVGAVGLPVFSGMQGGIATLAGPTGGFLWGFFALVILCGVKKALWARLLLGMLGLLACHTAGVMQFAAVTERGFLEAMLVASAPFLLKDIISIAAAALLAPRIIKGTAAN